MKRTKKTKLVNSGWKIGSVQEFLNLSEEEMTIIEIKRSLTKMLKEQRETNSLTQVALAKLLGSSQSRVAKMEAAASDVSLELIFKALLTLGISRKDLGKAIAA